MKYHPVISIILGAFAIFVFILILARTLGEPNINIGIMGDISLVTATLILFVGGFIATYFTKDMKIRYGIYLGLILASLVTIGEIGRNLVGYKGIGIAITLFVIFPLFTGIGGFIARMTEKNNRQLFKSKHLTNGFSPIIAVMVGFIVATVCAVLLELIAGINSASTTYGVFDFVIGAISLLIGGFVTLFLVKEKKIQYGFYVCIIVIITSILKLYTEIVQGIVIHESYYVRTCSYLGYFLFAGLGGYLGIIVTNHKLKNNK
jgi:hypothetical protein